MICKRRFSGQLNGVRLCQRFVDLRSKDGTLYKSNLSTLSLVVQVEIVVGEVKII